MTKNELIEKLTAGIPALRSIDSHNADETIRPLVGYLLQLLALETQEQHDYWHGKSIEQLALEQGVRPIQRLEDVWGKGADLWKDDEDFESFLRATQGLD